MPQPPADNNPDQIVEDVKSLAVKEKVMARQKTSSVLNSISKIAMFVGTMFTTAGATMGLGALTGAAAAVASTPIIIGVLAVGAAFLATAIATDYAQSRIWQSCTFDNLEANADSTARHLVKELKTNNMCLTVEQNAPCAAQPQKEWAKHIEAQRLQQQAATSR